MSVKAFFTTVPRSAVLSIRRRKGVAIAVVLILGVTIGFVTLVFNIMNAYLWRPLPFAEPDRLVAIEAHPAGEPFKRLPTRAEAIETIEQSVSSFDHVAGISEREPINIRLGEEVRQISGARVTSDFFEMLGARPLLGRTFTKREASEAEGSTNRFVVLSYDVWTSGFQERDDVVGVPVRINGEIGIVLGVMPQGFEFDFEDVWLPLTDGQHVARIIGRLRRGVSPEAAAFELTGVDLARTGADRPVLTLQKDPMRRAPAGAVISMLGLFIGATVMMLLVAAANVIGLLLAVGSSRQGERGIRSALGATQARIFAESITESLILGAAAGLVGLLVAHWGTKLLLAIVPNNVPGWLNFGVDFRVLLFATATATVAAMMIGWLPARQATRIQAGDILKTESAIGAPRSTAHMRNGLIVVELSLSVALVFGTVMAWRTADRLEHIDTGYQPERVLQAQIGLSPHQYASSDRILRFHQELIAALKGAPGVEAVTLRASLAGFNDDSAADSLTTAIHVESRDASARLTDPRDVDVSVVGDAFLRVTGLPLLHGRFFADADARGTPRVAVVSRQLATDYGPVLTRSADKCDSRATGHNGPKS